jgi:hypothetical protein
MDSIGLLTMHDLGVAARPNKALKPTPKRRARLSYIR